MKTLRAIGKVMSPQVREIAKGRPVMRFALVERSKDGGNTWHTCVAWGDTAAKMSSLVEGDMVEVEARTVTRSYTGSGGDRRIVTEQVVSSFKDLTPSKP